MDRFIAAYDISSRSTSEIFKIQYGQIYRVTVIPLQLPQNQYLKSNMDRFIAQKL